MDSTWIKDVRAYAMAEFFTDVDAKFHDDFFEAASAVMVERKLKPMRVGTEGDALTYGYRMKFFQWLEDAGHAPVDVGYDLEIVRVVKTPEELVRLHRATAITVKAHESFRAAIKPGNTVLLMSFDTTCANAGKGTKRSSADMGGAMLGLILAIMTTYRTYKVASMIPGKNAPAYNLTTETPAVAP